jgi:hypothetical protein
VTRKDSGLHFPVHPVRFALRIWRPTEAIALTRAPLTTSSMVINIILLPPREVPNTGSMLRLRGVGLLRRRQP